MAKQQQKKKANAPTQLKNKQNTATTFPSTLLNDNERSKRKLNVTTLVPSSVFVARNFMDQSECEAFIQCAEDIGFEKVCSSQTREYAQRECGRISRNDWDMADKLYQRMKPMVDEIARQVVVSSSDAAYAPVTCNGNLRLYKYEKNMSFGRHYDGSERISKFDGGNTEITVLIYLTSCKGGATRFYLPSSTKRGGTKKSKSENSSDGVAFVPEAGSILMHMHGDRCLAHEADPVIDGVKYVLRTDIVYALS